ncbi:hypothetical protein L218DRAFT_948645 [Marasmius fiardii PR-910]|nr:hypothetical protein L218DRAFT_948645 [Marasmius fiardii PR-910]
MKAYGSRALLEVLTELPDNLSRFRLGVFKKGPESGLSWVSEKYQVFPTSDVEKAVSKESPISKTCAFEIDPKPELAGAIRRQIYQDGRPRSVDRRYRERRSQLLGAESRRKVKDVVLTGDVGFRGQIIYHNFQNQIIEKGVDITGVENHYDKKSDDTRMIASDRPRKIYKRWPLHTRTSIVSHDDYTARHNP